MIIKKVFSGGLTVVVPTYNEVEALPSLIKALLALPLSGLRIMVVDDSSPDGTGKLADALAESYEQVSVLHRKVKDGLGRAYVDGFLTVLDQSSSEWIVQMDADGSHPVEMIPELLKTALKTNAELVIGSRYIQGGSIDNIWGLNRKSWSWFANWYVNWILNLGIQDATAGFKLWNAYALQRLDLPHVCSNGYAFQVEMNFLARRQNYRIVEVPIHFTERSAGRSKMSLQIKLESALRPWILRWQYRHHQ